MTKVMIERFDQPTVRSEEIESGPVTKGRHEVGHAADDLLLGSASTSPSTADSNTVLAGRFSTTVDRGATHRVIGAGCDAESRAAVEGRPVPAATVCRRGARRRGTMRGVSQEDPSRVDVLVVGAGPAGAAAAFWLAEARSLGARRREEGVPAGEDLRRRPDAPCGAPARRHGPRRPARATSTATRGCARSPTASPSSSTWPDHPDFPPYGYVVRRRDLDEMVAEQAVKAGATLWQGAEAVAPLVEDGLVTGAAIARKDTGTTETVRAKYVVVADGANSRFGRALGTARDRTYPMGMAIRGYFTSPYHDEPWIESPSRPPGPRRQPHAGVRVDLPGRRRHGERRRRAPRHVHRLHHASTPPN